MAFLILRQADFESRPRAGRGLICHRSKVGRYDLTDDMEPQTRALRFARYKWLENIDVFRNPTAGIADYKEDFIIPGISAYRESPASWHGFDCISCKI